ncbi:hypothetical protein D3C78_1722500 [compost metagenome]
MNSCSVLALEFCGTKNTMGTLISREIGAKSFCALYGSFLYRCGFMVKAASVAANSV